MTEELTAKGTQVVPAELSDAANKLLKGEIKWEPSWRAMGKAV